jgi:hypothetical protein
LTQSRKHALEQRLAALLVGDIRRIDPPSRGRASTDLLVDVDEAKAISNKSADLLATRALCMRNAHQLAPHDDRRYDPRSIRSSDADDQPAAARGRGRSDSTAARSRWVGIASTETDELGLFRSPCEISVAHILATAGRELGAASTARIECSVARDTQLMTEPTEAAMEARRRSGRGEK